jgi:tRNA (guanine-N7-)-methyltransferase
VEVEVGPGKGMFLATAAAARPGHDFLGVEMAFSYARRAAARAAKLGRTTVRVAAADARRVVREQIPDASVTALHVYFPDPWWKKRHKKRRVVSPELVEAAARILVPGGTLSLATDVEEYYGVMRELVGARPEFAERPAPAANEPRHDLDYLTNFERKFRIEGRAIYRAKYERRG